MAFVALVPLALTTIESLSTIIGVASTVADIAEGGTAIASVFGAVGTATDSIVAQAAVKNSGTILKSMEKVATNVGKNFMKKAEKKIGEKAGKKVVQAAEKNLLKKFSKAFATFMAKYGIKALIALISVILTVTVSLIIYYYGNKIKGYVGKKVKKLLEKVLHKELKKQEKLIHMRASAMVMEALYKMHSKSSKIKNKIK